MMKAEDLKKSVLQMAMQGKLVPQNPNDEPASILLEKIKQEKEQLIKNNNARKDKLDLINEDTDIPYDIPPNWEWIRFGEMGIFKKGPFGSSLKKSMFVPKNENTIKVYEQKNAIQKNSSLGEYYITKDYYQKSMKNFTVKSGDVIVSCAGTIGETYVMPKNIELGIINQALMKISLVQSLDINYFLYCFEFIIKKESLKTSKGSAIKNIPPFKTLKNILVPLPPLNEQKRIVEKLEQILPQIEQYGKYEQQLTKLNNELPEKLKKSILQEAIQGKLVPQNPNDEPATKLLKKIKQEKEQLIKEGKIKRNKNESTIYKKDGHWYEVIDMNNEIKCIDEEIPFEIPELWTWVRIDTVTNIIMGQSPKGEYVNENGDGMEFHQGKIFFGDKYLLKSNKITTKPSKISEKNSLLLCVRAPVGKINLVDRTICIGRGLASLKPISVNLDYFYYLLLNYEEMFNQLATGSTFKAIKKDIILNTLIPIPPKNEQILIKKTIEKLFDYIK